MTTFKAGQGDDTRLDNQALLQIHLAEYQALTTRCSYWVTVQVALLPLFLIVIGIMAQMWKELMNHPLLLWVGILIMQLLVMGYLHIGLEIYRAVYYIECDLRPLVRAMTVGHKHFRFWHYEVFLAQRRRREPIWEEYILPLCDLAIMGWAVLVFTPRVVIEYIFLIVNIISLIIILINTWKLSSMRSKYTQCTMSA